MKHIDQGSGLKFSRAKLAEGQFFAGHQNSEFI